MGANQPISPVGSALVYMLDGRQTKCHYCNSAGTFEVSLIGWLQFVCPAHLLPVLNELRRRALAPPESVAG